MKSEQVVAQHPVQQFFLPREPAEDLRIGPGYVPKLGDDQIRIAFLQHARQERKVKILNKYERRCIAGLLQHCARKDLVDFAIRLPVLGTKYRPGEHNVTERPQGLIGEAVVVSLFLAWAQPNAPQGEAWIFRRNAHMVEPIYGSPIRITTSVCDPGAATGAHDRIEGHRQATGRLHAFDRSCDAAMYVRLPVRYQDELVIAQLRVNQL